jgi:anti-sigma factor RsiW
MDEQTAHDLLMDELYDEISSADKEKLEAYLADHPELQKELAELRETQSLLQQAPEVEPTEKLHIVGTERRSPVTWIKQAGHLLPRSGWGKTALATAACLLLLLVALSLADLTVQSNKAGFTVSFGEVPAQQTSTITASQTEAIVEEIRRENENVLIKYADMLNKHNKQQLQQVVEHFQRQRTNDLQLIDEALNQYQQKTETQITQTQQVLGEVIQTVAVNNQQ